MYGKTMGRDLPKNVFKCICTIGNKTIHKSHTPNNISDVKHIQIHYFNNFLCSKELSSLCNVTFFYLVKYQKYQMRLPVENKFVRE